MKWLLLVAVLLAGPARGEEAAPPSVREKLRARIVESLPPLPPRRDDKPEPESPVLVLEPMVVTESRGVRELGKLLVSEQQRTEAEAFSVTKGGTIYRSDRLELGIWWAPEGGWQLLKFKW